MRPTKLSCPALDLPPLKPPLLLQEQQPSEPSGIWRTPGGCKRRKRSRTWQIAKTFKAFMMAYKHCTAPGSGRLAQSDQLMGPHSSRTATRFLPAGEIILRVSSTTPTLSTHIFWIISQTCRQPRTWTSHHFTQKSSKPLQG